MPEPRGLNLGKPVQTAEPVQTPHVAMTPAVMPATQQVAVVEPPPEVKRFINEVNGLGQSEMAATASVSDQIASSVKMGDIDDLGQTFNQLLVQAKRYDPSDFAKKKRFFGLLGALKIKVQEIKNQYATVDQQVDALVRECEQRMRLFQQRVGDLTRLAEENKARHTALGAAIDKAEPIIAWMEANPPPVDTTDAFTVQAASEWQNKIDTAKKKVDDLRRSQVLCEQFAPAIEQMIRNSLGLVDQFATIKTTTIPVLKQTFALYILNLEQSRGAEFGKQTTDLTNDMLKKNAEMLRTNTVAVSTNLARSVVDLSTLQETQAKTIEAIQAAERIRSEMRQRLASERPQLEALSQDLARRIAAQPAT